MSLQQPRVTHESGAGEAIDALAQSITNGSQVAQVHSVQPGRKGAFPRRGMGLFRAHGKRRVVCGLAYTPDSAMVPETVQSTDEAFKHVDSLLFERGVYYAQYCVAR